MGEDGIITEPSGELNRETNSFFESAIQWTELEKEKKQAKTKEAKGDVFLGNDELKTEKLTLDLYCEAMKFWEERRRLDSSDREECWERLAILYAKIGWCLRSGNIWMDEDRHNLDTDLYYKADTLRAAVRSRKGLLAGIDFFYKIVDDFEDINEAFTKKELQTQFQRLFNIFVWANDKNEWCNYNMSNRLIEFVDSHEHDIVNFEILEWIEIGHAEYIVTDYPIDLAEKEGMDWQKLIDQDKDNIMWKVTDSDKKDYSFKLERIKRASWNEYLYREHTDNDARKDLKRHVLMSSGQMLAFRKRHNIELLEEVGIWEGIWRSLKKKWVDWSSKREYWYY